MVWVPAVTFLVGIGLGALVVGVAGGGDSGAASTPPPSTSPSSPSPSGGTAVVVPNQCLEAARTVREATDLIRSNVTAIRDFQAQKIVDFLNQLEDLDQQARQQAAACQDVSVQQRATGSASPSPS